MSTSTPKLGLIKPAAGEKFSRSTYNNNLDLIDTAAKGIPIIPGVPAGVTPKFVPFLRTVSKGAGGDDPNAANATDANGYGGFWWSDLGITFTSVLSVQLTGFHALDGFMHTMSILDFNTTRVKFKAWRLSPNGPANGYGTITVNGIVAGY